MTRRKGLNADYGRAMDLLKANVPTVAGIIAVYVKALNDECAHHRAVGAQLRAELEAVHVGRE